MTSNIHINIPNPSFKEIEIIHRTISSHRYVLSSQFQPVQWTKKPSTLLASWEYTDFVSKRWWTRNNKSIIWISLPSLYMKIFLLYTFLGKSACDQFLNSANLFVSFSIHEDFLWQSWHFMYFIRIWTCAVCWWQTNMIAFLSLSPHFQILISLSTTRLVKRTQIY